MFEYGDQSIGEKQNTTKEDKEDKEDITTKEDKEKNS